MGKLLLQAQIGTRLTLSAGLASFPHDCGDAAALTRCADTALYAAKRAGRDRAGRYRGNAGRPMHSEI